MAGLNHDDAHDNIAIGSYAGDAMGGFANVDNIFIGKNAGGGTWETAASLKNIAIGNYTMDAALDGALNNTCVGYNTLSALSSGDNNVAIGNLAGD